MTIKKLYKLTNLERICTLCNKDLDAKDIIENNYIETYKNRHYRLAHRTCYNNYLKYVKESVEKYGRRNNR